MNPLEERLNAQLEQYIIPPGYAEHQPNGSRSVNPHDSEIAELVDAAHRFQAAPQLRVDPAFADVLERRVLRHALAHQHQHQAARGWLFLRGLRGRLALAGVLCLLLLGGGLLAFTHTANPIYAVTQIVQHIMNPSKALADQAQANLASARKALDTLPHLTGQPDIYLQSLSDFEEQRLNAANAIASLPTGVSRQRFNTQLSALESDARTELSALLPTLSLQAGEITTGELGKLGMAVPSLTGATLILPTHPNGQATIILSGANLQPGARLLVNGRQLSATGTPRNGQMVFVLDWNGEEHPHSLGLRNPDGTVAQTLHVSIHDNDGRDNNGNGNGNKNGNGIGNGKPTATPTPHH